MNPQDRRRIVQTTAEDTVSSLLQDAGYDVQTNGSHARADLTINGRLAVEVKGATWTKHAHSKGRYQFNTRQHADVYILVCLHNQPRFFVIPGNVIGARTNVAIWSKFPSKYNGRWSEYCDNWGVIERALT